MAAEQPSSSTSQRYDDEEEEEDFDVIKVPDDLCRQAILAGLTPLDISLLTESIRRNTAAPSESVDLPRSSFLKKYPEFKDLPDSAIYGKPLPYVCGDSSWFETRTITMGARPPMLRYSSTTKPQDLLSTDFLVLEDKLESGTRRPVLKAFRQIYHCHFDYRFLASSIVIDTLMQDSTYWKDVLKRCWTSDEYGFYKNYQTDKNYCYKSNTSYGENILKEPSKIGYKKLKNFLMLATEVAVYHFLHSMKSSNVKPKEPNSDMITAANRLSALLQPVRVVPPSFRVPKDLKFALEMLGSRYLDLLVVYIRNFTTKTTPEMPSDLVRMFEKMTLKKCVNTGTAVKRAKLLTRSALLFVPVEASVLAGFLLCDPKTRPINGDNDLFYPTAAYQDMVRQTWTLRQIGHFTEELVFKHYSKVRWSKLIDGLSELRQLFPVKVREIIRAHDIKLLRQPVASCDVVLCDESDMDSDEEYEPDENGYFPYEIPGSAVRMADGVNTVITTRKIPAPNDPAYEETTEDEDDEEDVIIPRRKAKQKVIIRSRYDDDEEEEDDDPRKSKKKKDRKEKKKDKKSKKEKRKEKEAPTVQEPEAQQAAEDPVPSLSPPPQQKITALPTIDPDQDPRPYQDDRGGLELTESLVGQQRDDPPVFDIPQFNLPPGVELTGTQQQQQQQPPLVPDLSFKIPDAEDAAFKVPDVPDKTFVFVGESDQKQQHRRQKTTIRRKNKDESDDSGGEDEDRSRARSRSRSRDPVKDKTTTTLLLKNLDKKDERKEQRKLEKQQEERREQRRRQQKEKESSKEQRKQVRTKTPLELLAQYDYENGEFSGKRPEKVADEVPDSFDDTDWDKILDVRLKSTVVSNTEDDASSVSSAMTAMTDESTGGNNMSALRKRVRKRGATTTVLSNEKPPPKTYRSTPRDALEASSLLNLSNMCCVDSVRQPMDNEDLDVGSPEAVMPEMFIPENLPPRNYQVASVYSNLAQVAVVEQQLPRLLSTTTAAYFDRPLKHDELTDTFIRCTDIRIIYRLITMIGRVGELEEACRTLLSLLVDAAPQQGIPGAREGTGLFLAVCEKVDSYYRRLLTRSLETSTDDTVDQYKDALQEDIDAYIRVANKFILFIWQLIKKIFTSEQRRAFQCFYVNIAANPLMIRNNILKATGRGPQNFYSTVSVD
ncbi:hypothetical protein [Cyprinid herpesvirus 2]|uniref:Uncharacterized protein n=1 Tax=Cyprinid herpesvirus 2 TaxID=317878 RepID=A0A0E3XAN8_CYHV2|nr:hypothetical protein [Cyprinid herpesvirus 2]